MSDREFLVSDREFLVSERKLVLKPDNQHILLLQLFVAIIGWLGVHVSNDYYILTK